MALADAGVAPEAIGYINAHGTSTPFNDKNETAAIKAVFGEHARALAVSSTKSMTGHTWARPARSRPASRHPGPDPRVPPPTINYDTPDPECDLDYVPNVRARGGWRPRSPTRSASAAPTPPWS
ncbi:MAG: hypothetical protein HS111_22860 [Kofleriaceae bacterium]|nr:hypothetical protein [Kofleriaceae bacterium]